MNPYNNLQQPDHHIGPTVGSGSQHQQLNPMDRTLREVMPKCPRCSSTDTTFSFYANRKLNQPRYICKRCHRHWTLGGALRVVPVRGQRPRKWSSKSPTVSLDQPPLRFNSSLNNAEGVWSLDYGHVNYNSTSASMGGGGGGGSTLNYGPVGSALSGGGSGGATGSIILSPGWSNCRCHKHRNFPYWVGWKLSPRQLLPL